MPSNLRLATFAPLGRRLLGLVPGVDHEVRAQVRRRARRHETVHARLHRLEETPRRRALGSGVDGKEVSGEKVKSVHDEVAGGTVIARERRLHAHTSTGASVPRAALSARPRTRRSRSLVVVNAKSGSSERPSSERPTFSEAAVASRSVRDITKWNVIPAGGDTQRRARALVGPSRASESSRGGATRSRCPARWTCGRDSSPSPW